MTVKEIRDAYGLTQKELAELIGLPKRTVENWEEGKSSPPPYAVKLIAFYLEHRKGEE